jgi:hypothetical protein
MLTEFSQDSFEFASVGRRKVKAAFDGGAITSNASAPCRNRGPRWNVLHGWEIWFINLLNKAQTIAKSPAKKKFLFLAGFLS